jgi:hypothetical protein
MASNKNPLPAPKSDQNYVGVSAIEGGMITLPDEAFVSPSNPWDKRSVPSLAFLIEHPGSTSMYLLDQCFPYQGLISDFKLSYSNMHHVQSDC